jgi:uncharacterized protein DUF262
VSFQTPITIRKAIDHIHHNEYVLPAIQREFVWGIDRICKLFDSLLRGYPIGSFLFWKVDRDHCKQYAFYGFLSEYHARDRRHNPSVDLTGSDGVTAILDGQQRLTSISIGLRGTHAAKLPHKRWNNPEAFPRRRLHLDLLSPASGEGVDLRYDFRFLSEDDLEHADGRHWFPVGQVLTFASLRDITKYLRAHDLLASEYAEQSLYALYDAVCEKKLINHYLEEDQDLEKVLNIFVRVNSGGLELSYSDLLLSIATAQWEDVDAREAVHDLVDDLNRIGGEGAFHFDKDFVLKSALVLSDLEIAFKVQNFRRENTRKIEAEWPRISAALRLAVTLAHRLGYNGWRLTASNSLIPIAYYLLRRDLPAGFAERSKFGADREAIRSWLARSLLKRGTFGSGLDTTLRAARNVIAAQHDRFPAEQLDKELARIGRALRFEDEELDDLMDETWGRSATFSILALLYPHVDFANRHHEDHIFPRSRFTAKRLRAAGVPESQLEDFIERVDCIGNLQLLEGTPNQEKSAKLPGEWLQAHQPKADGRKAWLERNYVDALPDDITGFLDFYEQRRAAMKARLAELLAPLP